MVPRHMHIEGWETLSLLTLSVKAPTQLAPERACHSVGIPEPCSGLQTCSPEDQDQPNDSLL